MKTYKKGWNSRSVSICWKCAKATDSFKCNWVSDFTICDGMIFDECGNLIKCPHFEKEKNKVMKPNILDIDTFCAKLNISKRTLYRLLTNGLKVVKDTENKIIGVDIPLYNNYAKLKHKKMIDII